jgi:hypothetical protein
MQTVAIGFAADSDVARKHRTSHELRVAVNYTKSYRGQRTVLE